ncbi:hypothetical protein [Phenylobacterium sp.]|jgi:hypothetical protein|uniref:hypothetical protein n=1 Tax=Phenylobacterium sp. TaxID=1871053 RepID=UPI002F936BFE
MQHRQFKADLVGSDETLDHLLDRLRSFSIRQPSHPGGNLPPDWEAFVTSRRPPKGAGGAEAPIPVERPAADLYAVA